jgi:peroxiredoxin
MFPHERSLVKRLANRPFALLGVSCDEDHDALKRMIESEHLTWRSWVDNPENPICSEWHVEYLPSIYILDPKGIIRFTPDDFSSVEDVDRVVDELLAEAEQTR